MRIIVDSTNPENNEPILYLRVVEVPEQFICDREDNLFDYKNIIFDYNGDIYDEFTTEASFVIDVSENMAELNARAGEELIKSFTYNGEPDDLIIAINQTLTDLVKVTGANGVYWPYY